MGKMRISVLAKELGIKSNCLIEQCLKEGFSEIHHHANTLDDEQVKLLKSFFVKNEDKPDASVDKVVKKEVNPEVSTSPAATVPAQVTTVPARATTVPVSTASSSPVVAPAKKFVKNESTSKPYVSKDNKNIDNRNKPNVQNRQNKQNRQNAPNRHNLQNKLNIPNKHNPQSNLNIPGKQNPLTKPNVAGVQDKNKSNIIPATKRFVKIQQKGATRFGGDERFGSGKDKSKKGKGFEAYRKSQIPGGYETGLAGSDIIEKEKLIQVELPVSVKELCVKFGIKANDIIAKLLIEHNIRSTVNQNLDKEVVELLGIDYGYEIEIKEPVEEKDEFDFKKIEGNPEDFVSRTPIVAFLGHVDHGKTSLLDSIRLSSVATGEAGGITQHMGAYHVEANDKRVIFLDTPGHEAFTAMRARGANITDVVVLVVAADDGVMPQTEEALNHAKAAEVPILVAINKVDKPGANVLKVKQQLATLELSPEEWGGKTQVVETSAVTKQGLSELIEKILLEAEILDLKYNPKNKARGVVLEAQIHAGKGVVANVIVRDGVLKQGDIVFCGHTYGRVRAMLTDRGVATKKAGSETPLMISDFSEVPNAGDHFYVVDSITKAKEFADQRLHKNREFDMIGRSHVTLDNLFTKIEEGNIKEIRVILKADFKGSVEVLKKTVEGLSIGEVKIRALHVGVGNITESDVLLGDASDAIIIGFCVSPDDKSKILADEKGVDVRLYKVIYDVTKDIKAAMEGMLEPEKRDHVTGHVEIQRIFKISRYGNIAGCLVKNGKISRNSLVRLIRDEVVLHTGKLESLRIGKDDTKEVKSGHECGLNIDGFDSIQVGDIVEAYEILSIARKLE